MKGFLGAFGLVVLLGLFSGCIQQEEPFSGYLFAYFNGNAEGKEHVFYAVSDDGFNYRALNGQQPVLESKVISKSGGVRDPHVLRGEDGHFYMVLTDLCTSEMGWENTAMVLLRSENLVHWEHAVVDIAQRFPEQFGDVLRVWAPQTIYDPSKEKYMLYWSMLQPGGRDVIYFAYVNDDFTDIETVPDTLLYKDGACIDGDMIFRDGKYYLFFKNEDRGAKGIMLAISDKINEGFEIQEGYVDQTSEDVEGSGVFQMIGSDTYILMYDVYRSGKYQFCESTDLRQFKVIDDKVSMDFHPRHGSIIPITQPEMDALMAAYP